MDILYRVLPWMLLLLISVAAEEFLVYDFDLDSNHTENRSSGAYNTTNVVCVREHLYDKLNIKEVLGKWKVRELYLHLSKEGVNEYHSCPEVTIWEEDRFPTTTFGVGLLIFNMGFGNLRRQN